MRCLSPEREAFAMNGMRSLNPATDSQSRFSRNALVFILESTPGGQQDSSDLTAGGPLMRLIEGSHVFRERSSMSSWHSGKRWKMQSSTATRKIQTQSTRPCRCQPRQGNIHRRDGSGKGFDFEKTVGNASQQTPIPNTGPGIR